jgi:hypothetical protein
MVMMCMCASNKKAADLANGGESSQGIQHGGDAKKPRIREESRLLFSLGERRRPMGQDHISE